MSFLFGDTKLGNGSVYRTPYGTLIPPYGRVVAAVRATDFDDDDVAMKNLRVSSISAALARCKSGRGDIILVLPGHTESAAALTGLVAGTKIIGMGHGTNRPTITWAAVGSTWAVNVADVAISGLKLDLGGADEVTKAINVTGANSLIENCHINMGTSATLQALIGIEYGTGSGGAQFLNNVVEGIIAGPVVDGILVAAVANNIRICDNEFFYASATTAMVRVGAVAALGLRILRNHFYNSVAASTACVAFGAAASTGILAYNTFSTLNNGTATDQGVTFGAGCLVRCFQNYSCDQPILSGILTPVACT